jgi:hypothetical protein
MRVDQSIFVPAILGIGLLFSLATLARDSVHRLRGRGWMSRRTVLQGRASGLIAALGVDAAMVDRYGRRRRATYAVIGLVFILLALYLLAGSYGNYVGWTGWVESIGWIWFAYLVFIGAFAVLGSAAAAVALRWRRPPSWTRPFLARTPLGAGPPASATPRGPVRSLRPQVPERSVRERVVGVVRIDERAAAAARTVAVIWSAVALVTFSVLAVRGWVPESADPSTIEPSVSGPVQMALLALFGVGALVASRFEAFGAALLAMAAAGLAILSSIQYPTWAAVVVAFALGAPAFLHWLAWQRGRHLHHVVVLAIATVFALLGVWVAADRLQAFTLGPAHPSSTVAVLPPSDVDWMWAGGTTESRTTIAARMAAPHDAVRLVVSRSEDLTDPQWTSAQAAVKENDNIVRFAVEPLLPDTQYFYAVEADGALDETRTGVFRTFPVGPASFEVAFGSCARSGSNGAVFDAIRQLDPLLYMPIGDLHYANIRDEEVEPFLLAYRSALAANSQSALYRSTSSAYVWDDHDYGGNDANRLSSSRAAAQEAYRLAVPHYPLEGGSDLGPIYQAFTIGRVRFIITDARSERDPADVDDPSMLGAAQLSWFEQQLRDAAAYPVVVWVNGSPWIDSAGAGKDSWGGFAGERERIGSMIDTLGLSDNLVMLSGDAHMVAIDDGSNSGYGGAGFPVFHAAALDRPGGVKGGPYSEGTFPGAGQFGTLDVHDPGGDLVTLTMTGRTWDGRVLVEHSVDIPVE